MSLQLLHSPIPPTAAAILAAVLYSTACSERPIARAGEITAEVADEVIPPGTTVGARLGDYYLRNSQATFIIQRPGTEIALGPYGGTLIDVALPGTSDHFGEMIPVIALGRTIRIDSMRLLSDGAAGEDAVLEATGVDATNIYYNIEALEPDILSYQPDGSGLLGHDPDSSMGLSVRVTYRLPKDEPRLTVTYAFTNTGSERMGVPFGILLDTRGHVSTFAPGRGFENNLSKSLNISDLSDLLALEDTTEQSLSFNDELAIGFLPRRVGQKTPPRVIGITVPSLGGALLLEARTAIDAATEPAVTLNSGETDEIVVDVLAKKTPAEVLEWGWKLLNTGSSDPVQLGDVSGCVTLTGGGAAAGIRVGLTHLEKGVLGTFTTDSAGCFKGRVPAGSYTAIAGALYRSPSEEVSLQVSADTPARVDLALAALGKLKVEVDTYNRLSATTPEPHACRVTLLGEPQMTSHPALGAPPIDNAGGVVSRLKHLWHCNNTIDLAPGRYLALVTRGPEFTRIEKLVEVSSGATTELTGALYRVVDTDGYAASDFHVHSIYSSDSAVPADQRVLSMAAEGMDFWASTDHDVVDDYMLHIAEAGLTGELLSVPGAEVTTFDTGHFNAYPLDIVTSQSNGGSPNWARNAFDVRPSMQELFDTIHARGALVQVNHPRGGAMSIGAHFTRAGLEYDPVTLQPFSNKDARPIPNATLRYPDDPDFTFFSPDFDVIEVMNGVSTYVSGGMVKERSVERVGQDWMNLLSGGHRIVATGNSDTHSLSKPPGNPRTMVGGHFSTSPGGVAGLLAGLARGDAVLTTGPMLRVSLTDGGGNIARLGEVLSPDGPDVTLHVHVEAADWYDVDVVDVIANVFMPVMPSGEEAPTVVGPLPITTIAVPRPNGGTGRVGAIDIPLDLRAAPFFGEDSWIVVRVGGLHTNMFPVMSSGGGAVDTSAVTADDFFSGRYGHHPFAMSNPVFVDMDGDGRWRGHEM